MVYSAQWIKKREMLKSINAQPAKLLHISYAEHQLLSTAILYFATLNVEDVI